MHLQCAGEKLRGTGRREMMDGARGAPRVGNAGAGIREEAAGCSRPILRCCETK